MKPTTENEILNRYFDLVIQEGLYSTKKRLKFYLDYLFEKTNFDNKQMLDIGAGRGMFSFYAACKGAKIVSIEPEAEGSTHDSINKFKKIQSALGLTEVIQLEKTTFQNYNSSNKKFDIILLHGAINHLDETACINLQHDNNAIEKYNKIFEKIYNLANKRAELIITDCSKYNFFAKLNITNPFDPNIEWHKHQPPEYWSKLLLDPGFVNPKIRYTTPPMLYSIGKLLLSNKIASYFTWSSFCLTMEKK